MLSIIVILNSLATCAGKTNSDINLKKADKGTTTVLMNKTDNIDEALVQPKNKEHCQPLRIPMVKDTQERVN